MADSIAKTTTPDDFTVLDSYKDKNGDTVEGNFLVYITGVSLCCKDNTEYIKSIPIVIPPQ